MSFCDATMPWLVRVGTDAASLKTSRASAQAASAHIGMARRDEGRMGECYAPLELVECGRLLLVVA
jgi:hypothetical protein